ncbi:hypothetical protein ACPCI0_29105 [Streptomyces griseoincarnatus]
MTVWLAGMEITADRLNDYTADDSISSGLTVASGWSSSGFSAIRSKGTVVVDIILTRTGADIDGSTGNPTDVELCTLPEGWRPPVVMETIFGNNVTLGGVVINTTGVCTLRTTNTQNVNNGNTIRIHATFNLTGAS